MDTNTFIVLVVAILAILVGINIGARIRRRKDRGAKTPR